MNKGQITLSAVLTLGSMLAASILWVSEIKGNLKDNDAELDKRILVLEKSIPEMQEDIRYTRDNIIRLMERQGVTPVPMTTTTAKND